MTEAKPKQSTASWWMVRHGAIDPAANSAPARFVIGSVHEKVEA